MQVYLPIAELSMNLFFLVGIGGAVGFLSGLFGVGGGFLLTPLLIGLGVEELSVGPLQVPRVGQAIRSLSHSQCVAMADEALRQSRSEAILNLSLDLAKRHYGELLD